MSRNPYVFIVGCPRSGTTLLQRIVDAHPHLAVVNETRWIAKYFHQRLGLTLDGLVTAELVPKLLEHKRFSRLRVGRDQLEQLLSGSEPMHYAEFVSTLFDCHAAECAKTLAGDKTPGYAR